MLVIKVGWLCSRFFLAILSCVRCVVFALAMVVIFVLCQECGTLEKSHPFQQNQEIRSLCKCSQELEQALTQLETEIEFLKQSEKTSTPVIKSVYEMLTRCFTLLYNIQRFSQILVFAQKNKDKNDFVLCSIIIKNFSSYFKAISSRLENAGAEIKLLKQKKMDCINVHETKLAQYKGKKALTKEKMLTLAKTRVENVIQNDVIYHMATKSESLDELEAELEAENAIGILKDTKISTDLSLAYPVYGKIATEFGDQGSNGEMIPYISMETRPGAVVTSPANGLVVFCGRFLNYGTLVIISNGDYRVFLYGMGDALVSVADVVEVGDYIGEMQMIAKPIIKMELKKSGESLDPNHWLQQTLENGKVKKNANQVAA
jgi:hypothetical protein